MKFGERLAAAMTALDWGPGELSKTSGVAMPTISALVRRGSDRSNYVEELIAGFPPDKISHKWLRNESGTMKPIISIETVTVGKQESSLAPILAWEHESDLPQGDYVFIPRLEVHLSAGNGREQVEVELIKRLPQAFRADWIREKKLSPNKLASMNVEGDSMEPFIWDGETVVIDTSQTAVKDGKVYALWYDGGERVKRLYRLPGGALRIVSDNQNHAAIEVLADQIEGVRIIGRVVHKQGDGGL